MQLIINQQLLQKTLDVIAQATFPNIQAGEVYTLINQLRSLKPVEPVKKETSKKETSKKETSKKETSKK